MKETKSLFSAILKPMKPFIKKVSGGFMSFFSIIKKACNKVATKYKKANEKNKYTEPIVIIGTSCLLILFMVLVIRGATTIEQVEITNNTAEILAYENKYDEAVEEYKAFQSKEPWPIWDAKIADIYSLKGEINKSNSLLKEIIVVRDRIIKEEGYAKYKEKDIELINSMLFTFASNGEYDEVITFGEKYINDYGSNRDTLNILFQAYLVKGYTYKAEELIDKYPLDNKSAYDTAVVANMNIMLDRWDKGLELLKSAMEIDKNELKIYDVINTIYVYDSEKLTKSLEEKVNVTKDNSYKTLLAKTYAISKDTSEKAVELTKELEEEGIVNIGVDLVNFEAYNNLGEKDEAADYINEAAKKARTWSKESYTTYYLLSLKSEYNNKLEEALSYAKKAALADPKYSNTYGTLLPRLQIETGKFEPIEVYYRTALRKDPFNYKLIMSIADYYTNYQSNNDKGMKYYELLLEIKKEDSSLYKKIFDFKIKNEKYDEAIPYLEEAIKLDENDSDYYRILGTIHLNNENFDEGIELVRKAYSMNEKDSIALNNAGWYYITVENDIARGFDNIKSAYEDMPVSLDEAIKEKLVSNYNKAKKLYDEFLEDETKEFDTAGIYLIF